MVDLTELFSSTNAESTEFANLSLKPTEILGFEGVQENNGEKSLVWQIFERILSYACLTVYF